MPRGPEASPHTAGLFSHVPQPRGTCGPGNCVAARPVRSVSWTHGLSGMRHRTGARDGPRRRGTAGRPARTGGARRADAGRLHLQHGREPAGRSAGADLRQPGRPAVRGGTPGHRVRRDGRGRLRAARPRHPGRAPAPCAHRTAGRPRRLQPPRRAGALLRAAAARPAAHRPRAGAVLGRDGTGRRRPVPAPGPWPGDRGAVRRRLPRPRAGRPRRHLAGPVDRLAGAHGGAGRAGRRLTGDDRGTAADLATGGGARRLRERTRRPPVRHRAGGRRPVRDRGVHRIHVPRAVPGRRRRVLARRRQRPAGGVRHRVPGRGDHHRGAAGPLPARRAHHRRGHPDGGHARAVRTRRPAGGRGGVPRADRRRPRPGVHDHPERDAAVRARPHGHRPRGQLRRLQRRHRRGRRARRTGPAVAGRAGHVPRRRAADRRGLRRAARRPATAGGRPDGGRERPYRMTPGRGEGLLSRRSVRLWGFPPVKDLDGGPPAR
ncbi:Acetylornithine aminotransferase [Streptomyces misionensis JCM 4497]